MKKIIALALSLIMLLTCAAAFAETAEKETLTMAGAFSITYDKIPEYYSMRKIADNDSDFLAILESNDADKPLIILTIAFNDQWSHVKTLADATEEEILAVQEDFYRVTELNDGDLIFSFSETGLGTKLMIARDKDGMAGAVYCIYMGHELEIDLYPGSAGKAVTDAEIQTVIQFLTDLEFTPVQVAQ
jgi:hypothetical protein